MKNVPFAFKSKVLSKCASVGGATAEHLLAHGKEVRTLVRNREKAANWADQGVELVGTLPVYYNPTNRKSTMVATNDIGAEVATLLTGSAWSGQRVVKLGSMVSADEVAEQLGEVLNLDVRASAIPRAGWAEAFEQFGIPKGHTGPAEEMFEAVNAGWMEVGVEGTEHVAGTTSARDVFEAAQNAAKAYGRDGSGMRGTACWQSVPGVLFRLLRAVTVFLPTGLIVKAQLKNVENRPIDADSR